MGSIIPPGMAFQQAVKFGYAKLKPCKPYLAWVKSLPCCCGCGNPADHPHHPIDVGGYHGTGSKAPDVWAIPLTDGCHRELHADVNEWEAKHGLQLEHVALTMLQAVHEGVLRL